MIRRRANRGGNAGEHRQRRAMNVAGRDQLHARMTPDDRREFAGILEILAVHVPDAGLERRMVQEQQRRPIRRGRQRGVEPLQGRRIEFAMRLAGNARIQQQQIEPADLDLLIERPGRKRIASRGNAARINSRESWLPGMPTNGQLQRRQQPLEMVIFLRRRRIGQIARDHHEIGLRDEFVQRRDAALERPGGIDPAISQRARRLDMQIGNLRDANGF